MHRHSRHPSRTRHRSGRITTVVAVLLIAVMAQINGTVTASASTPDPAVWVGSPFAGTWPNEDGCPDDYPSDTCSLPSVHHIVYTNPVGGYLDDWAADLQGVSPGTPVVLY